MLSFIIRGGGVSGVQICLSKSAHSSAVWRVEGVGGTEWGKKEI